MKTLILFAALSLPLGVPGAEPAAPSPLCIDNVCAAETPRQDAIKWHPGHYMLVFRGDSHSTVMTQRIPEVCRESALQGIEYRADWFSLEPSRGTYDFTKIDQMYDALAACGKRLVLEVWAVEFGTKISSNIVPAYIQGASEFNGGVAKTKTGFIARLWETPVMDRLLAVYSALGSRYDKRPYFEGIVFTETATSGVQAGYTGTAWVAQLKRAAPAMHAAWPNTNILFFNNFIQGSTETQQADFIATLRANRAGTGGPDVLPPPANVLSERIYRGETGGQDLRGLMPAMYAVQTPELGGKEGTYGPAELYDHCVGTNRCSHMFWIRNTTKGGAAQQWDTGILPFLRAHPDTVATCPASYRGCAK